MEIRQQNSWGVFVLFRFNTNEIYRMFLVLRSGKDKTFTFDSTEEILSITYLRSNLAYTYRLYKTFNCMAPRDALKLGGLSGKISLALGGSKSSPTRIIHNRYGE